MNIFRITNILSRYFENPGHLLFFSAKKGNFEAVFKDEKTVLIQSIAQYLTSHKRLVIPQLGTFIVKEPGKSILFSELLKRDDGVLRGVLREAGLSELEAAGEIDRFVFEVRHAIQSGAAYPLEGLGELKPGANGTIAFHYDPTPVAAASPKTPAPDVATSAAASASADAATRTTVRTSAGPSADTRPTAADAATARPDVPAPDAQPASVTDSAEAPHAHPRHVSSDRVARSVEQAFAEPHVSPSAKMNPDPSVRGLRYGKPPKNTSGYTFVDRPTRRRADRFLWIAIAAAIIALGAIAFGYWRERHDQEVAEKEYLEYRQMIDSPSGTEAAEAQTEQPAQTE